VHPKGKSVGQIRANPIESYPNDLTERLIDDIPLILE